MGVRWDAVVTDSRYWSEPEDPAPADSAAGAGAAVAVQVWLFGYLADAIAERPLTLDLRTPFCVDDVIAGLGRRCGSEFLSKLTTSGRDPVRYCRVYVEGEEIEDTAAPVRVRGERARMEMILLTAAEGG